MPTLPASLPHWALVPPAYVAPRLPSDQAPLTIDGNLDKPAWALAPWSSPFGEIRGRADAPEGSWPTPQRRTRMKMLWDDDYLYVAAVLESDMPVVAEFTERNSPIFQRDSDFEVFVDPLGSCHAYKELEINAVGTVWNLMLDRPYSDGGSELSGRVAKAGEPAFYEVHAQRSATRLLSGRLGDAAGATWCVELALAHSDTIVAQPGAAPPKEGDAWRINFSRVEERGEINWTWAPQVVWEPRTRRFEGKVNMHLPDAWGFVTFGPVGGPAGEEAMATQAAVTVDEAWPLRVAAMACYYAQHAHREQHGSFAATVEQLAGLLPAELLEPLHATISETRGGGFIAEVRGAADGLSCHVNDLHELTVARAPPGPAAASTCPTSE